MTDWAQWSREAVAQLEARNREWVARHRLQGAAYQWDLPNRTLRLEGPDGAVEAAILLIGTVAGGEFLWAWANPAIDEADPRLEAVRAFGAEHDLRLLTDPMWPAGRPEAMEMLAVAGRILQADGAWIDADDQTTWFFLLFDIGARGGTNPT